MSFVLPLYYPSGFTAVIVLLFVVLVAFFVIWVWKLVASLVVGG